MNNEIKMNDYIIPSPSETKGHRGGRVARGWEFVKWGPGAHETSTIAPSTGFDWAVLIKTKTVLFTSVAVTKGRRVLERGWCCTE